MASNKRMVNRRNTAVLFDAVGHLIDSGRKRVATVINTELALLYWQAGNCINDHILQNKRAGYGEAVIDLLSARLTARYGKGWSARQLWTCTQCANAFSETQMLRALHAPLGWTHIRILSTLSDKPKRKFYLDLCIREKWSIRLLQERINSMLFEKTMASGRGYEPARNEPGIVQEEEPDKTDTIFKEPHVLNFLGLQEVYGEKDFAAMIVVELQKSLTEPGADFAFVARQKKINAGSNDYCIDLLFYHRRLARLVAIHVIRDKLKTVHRDQMDCCLRWLKEHETRPGEQAPVGLILCAGNTGEQIAVLTLQEEQSKAQDYLKDLPPRELLKQYLRQAIATAKQNNAGYMPAVLKHASKVEQLFIGNGH